MTKVAGATKSVAARLGGAYAGDRKAIMDSLCNSPGLSAARALSDATDALVSCVLDEVARTAPEAVNCVAVAAAGGYGRREMYPRSDVDVAFIAGSSSSDVEAILRRAFVTLSDALSVAGVRFGYCYTQPDDLEGLPVENLTALLDARMVAGNPLLFAKSQASLQQALGQAAFVLHHVRARLERHLETSFVAEPDLKETAGGLRDLHTASWIARASFGFSREQVWNSLRSRGVLTSAGLRALNEAADFLCALRWTLHSLGGRESLSRQKQTECATVLGYTNAQAMMADYYKHAQTVRRTLDAVANACQSASLDLEPGICVQARHIRITDPDLLRRDATAMMRVFHYAQAHMLELGPEAAVLTSGNAAMVSDAENARQLLDILTGSGAARVLRMMADRGVLQAVVPKFERLLCLVPPDLVHRFTVGEHTLRVIGELERGIREDSRLSDVMSRVRTPECLFVAALVHDVGKIDGEGDHANRGAVTARKFAEALGMSRRQCEAVEFLVREHTVMSDFARLRDVTDDRTARELAELVSDPEFLDMLLMLTFADFNAVGEVRLSELHRTYLLELHGRTRALLVRGTLDPDMERHRSRVKRELAPRKLTPEEIDRHCSSLPDRYMLNTSLKDMALHITLARAVAKSKAAVDFQDDRTHQHTRLTAATTDRHGLLSEIAGTLYALDISVHSAQVFTRADGVCLDILHVDCDGRSLAETKKDQVDVELTAVLEEAAACGELLERLGKPVHGLPDGTSAAVISPGSETEAVLEVRAPDMPGLLYVLTKHLQDEGLSIRSAKVATWGHRVRDVFYVTDTRGRRPRPKALERLVQSLHKSQVSHLPADLP